MLGNIEPALHAHIFPRFEDEPDELEIEAGLVLRLGQCA